MRFVAKRTGIEARLDRFEVSLLSSMVNDLLVLLGSGDGEVDPDADPLAALVGLGSGPVTRPPDPALARLLPDAYRDDDAAAADFRRYTETDLRAGKRAQATAVLASLAPYSEGGRVRLDRASADAWLGCLNDLRLVLGTRLEVTEETELDAAPDDPRAQALAVYGWLGGVQEMLISRLTPLA